MDEKLHSKDFPDCFHRVAIKGLCVRDGKILLARESKSLGDGWELPGGGLDFGEDIREGFKREITEETGLTIRNMSERPVYVWTTRVDKRRTLDWYYTLVVGYRVEFENLNFKSSDECLELRFFTPAELQKLDLHEHNRQTETFKDIFNPKDFEKDF